MVILGVAELVWKKLPATIVWALVMILLCIAVAVSVNVFVGELSDATMSRYDTVPVIVLFTIWGHDVLCVNAERNTDVLLIGLFLIWSQMVCYDCIICLGYYAKKMLELLIGRLEDDVKLLHNTKMISCAYWILFMIMHTSSQDDANASGILEKNCQLWVMR